jgi:peptide/nickel transport system ATP-binding protein
MLLEITDLHTVVTGRRRQVHAVNGVSLHLDQGEVLGIVGESGSGKTMTAMSILRLLPRGGAITSGSIQFDGTDLVSLPEREIRKVRGDGIGVVFQDPLSSLNPTMSIGDQIAENVLLHRPVSRPEALDRAVEVLSLVGLPQPRERIREYPHQFSGGMRQRAMIAIALACDPKLLIADEPTTALDVTIQKQILALIDGLRERLGMAVILVTHDLGVIAGHADRVAVMYAGKIAETASTDQVFAHARHPYTVALFDALPERVTQAGERLRTIPGMPPDLSAPLAGCAFAPRCANAQDTCTASDPPLAADGAHAFACFFPVDVVLQSAPASPDNEAGVDAVAAPVTETSPDEETSADSPATVASADDPTPVPAASPATRPVIAGPPGDPRPAPPDDETAPMLELAGLTKDFPVLKGLLRRQAGRISAVADVSLSVTPGSTLGIVGESGCGKTTVGRLIVGLEKPTSGTIRFAGADVANLAGEQAADYRRGIQYMFQDSAAAMDPRMRVGSIIREPMRLQHQGSADDQRRRVRTLLDEVGLPATAVDRYPHEFSGGQRQRICLARALALTPQVIIADEPVSALDVSVQAQVLNVLRDLQSAHGLTLIVISHDLAVIRYLADSIAVMYLGKLVEHGPAGQVYARPLHPYTSGLIAAVPVPDPRVERTRRAAGVTGELASAMNPPSGCRFRTRCPRASDVCAQQEPPLRVLAPGGHQVACHHPLNALADGREATTLSRRS